MNFILLGAGGREHAIAEKIAQSPLTKHLYIMPGNPGTALCGTNVPIKETNFEGIATFALENNVEIIISGPEAPLANGLSDFFSSSPIYKHIKIIGPNQKGAQLESSKDFSKNFMLKYKIPTAAYKTFTQETLIEGYQFLETLKAPYVLKADGLVGGKGVLIINKLEKAKYELNEMLNGKFGNASNKVVIEEFLDGIELSVFVLTDGKSHVILPEAKDYKRIGVGDKGLNTGGMGAVSPVSFINAAFMQKVKNQIISPTLAGLKAEKIDFRGFIFIGLMKCGENPYVIEYNVRMGDPETEVVFPRIKSDVAQLFISTADQNLDTYTLETATETATTVMLVSGGYPETYEKGKKIEHFKNLPIFHAGTSDTEQGLVTNGGRVIATKGFDKNLSESLKMAFATAKKIQFSGKYYRTDIGDDLQ